MERRKLPQIVPEKVEIVKVEPGSIVRSNNKADQLSVLENRLKIEKAKNVGKIIDAGHKVLEIASVFVDIRKIKIETESKIRLMEEARKTLMDECESYVIKEEKKLDGKRLETDELKEVLDDIVRIADSNYSDEAKKYAIEGITTAYYIKKSSSQR